MIKCNNLQKRVPMAGAGIAGARLAKDELQILKGITLEIKQGESVAIVGASGSGKSTLLGLLAGLDEASAGGVQINGVDLDGSVISKLYHPLAAMPSIHMTIAMVTADGIRATTRRPWARRAAAAYPPAVAAVVLLTANHYVLDVAAGTVLGRIASRVARRIYR